LQAETLKYFFLLFGPNDVLPLTDVVLNTEAHVFPRFGLGKLFATGWRRKPRDQDGNLLHITREEPQKAPPSPVVQQQQTQVVHQPPQKDPASNPPSAPLPPADTQSPQKQIQDQQPKMVPLEKPDPIVVKPAEESAAPAPPPPPPAADAEQPGHTDTNINTHSQKVEQAAKQDPKMVPLEKPNPIVVTPSDEAPAAAAAGNEAQNQPSAVAPPDAATQGKETDDNDDPVKRMQAKVEAQVKKGEEAMRAHDEAQQLVKQAVDGVKAVSPPVDRFVEGKEGDKVEKVDEAKDAVTQQIKKERERQKEMVREREEKEKEEKEKGSQGVTIGSGKEKGDM